MESTLPQVASTALINISLAWIVGILASRFWLRARTAPWQEAAVIWLSRTMVVALITCLAGVFLSLWTESAVMGDVPWLEAWPAFQAMLISTHYGNAGSAAAIILVGALFAHWRLSRSGGQVRYLGAMALLVSLVAVARVTIGHAFEHGLWSIAVWTECLHLLAISLWVGVVLISGWAILPRVLVSETFPSEERSAYLASMSNWATAALVVILATGAYNSYRVLGSPRDLVETGYGYVFVFKLGVVVLAIGLGGFNKFFGLPSAQSPNLVKCKRGLGIVIVALRVETIALLLALIAAAIMTTSAPPGQ
ncbi:putative copper resistance protein D [Paucimonas lemoignei]|uniref:Putative copper resistance protein D n=1 Tax=Paucimonas lemoignei TaxID=29443 RepID=A0A4R3HR04_PAULE|nr:CopD family protein [Paucimonas lemoignei]TCS33099.1 putative copper resistance protein D [Paucimonas lemoignei]